MLDSHREDLFWYILFLRITPIVPNFFINLASPLLNVPFLTFYFATLLGQLPLNFLHIRSSIALE
jgi:uncharacterized membrane protein YdjX (TVP38/TMEM64 family)